MVAGLVGELGVDVDDVASPTTSRSTLRQAVPGGFTIDDFHIDTDAATATCPAGQMRRR
ncbi:hypothetical protein ACFU8W_47885 [Streptomyces sp. NPDC057565]|uniref:hypothetical protein n=1 Tax=Streptomyces sp. NPDC057565 TaxID=3346169 RepID=UPI003687361C